MWKRTAKEYLVVVKVKNCMEVGKSMNSIEIKDTVIFPSTYEFRRLDVITDLEKSQGYRFSQLIL